jgi:hypothetical protein
MAIREKKQKVVFDKSAVREQAYEKYKYLLDFMAGTQGNYNKPGVSDYPMLAYVSSLINNTTILEIGTYQGGSAVMLTSNESNKVITYDIHHCLLGPIGRGIDFRIGDFMSDNINYNDIDIISLDVDPHDGIKESLMWSFLEDNWKGGLVCLDDIHNGAGMEDFWNSIDSAKHEKWDVSDIGHGWCGTGLVNFNSYFDVTFINKNTN